MQESGSSGRSRIGQRGALTVAVVIGTAAFAWFYAGHPLFSYAPYNIMAMTAFFSVATRLALGIWAPDYFRRKRTR